MMTWNIRCATVLLGLGLALNSGHAATMTNAFKALPATPLEVLKKNHIALYKLYVGGEPYHTKLTAYANMQGFRQPFENLATVVHEMIHIASAIHHGYYVEGTYYWPDYLDAKNWPSATNNLIEANLRSVERGPISNIYMSATPKNHLGNILDEINAYSHVIEFVCANEAGSAHKQTRNLLGFLHVEEAYLRVVRSGFPQEYQRLSNQTETRGALRLITERAWKGLTACGVKAQDIPSQETTYFFSLAP